MFQAVYNTYVCVCVFVCVYVYILSARRSRFSWHYTWLEPRVSGLPVQYANHFTTAVIFNFIVTSLLL
jgi:hypothetical protein